ncbi:siderophore ABC transporter substrate-binding protein [Bordetella hinzii]|uniref:siderophore ABC transporter substrate-binding protein n=1 Tax=Bordetella hinzii TaxID=103855 RepID=UPI00045B8459|nr:siderophore ABC transporter substrate-binding protein [Bordetella hinzii]KCB47854.1 ABC transporter, substrate-binding protein, YclQ family [Bordetella hinzii 4161]KXA74412.1 iron ABC transporter substrate-binding protein [Bordetella hinzii LMG 13501]QDJ35693.1 iron ABC transporter substrate-binding protein [Bordetella hinzii]QWF39926.1 siderophore ABC transporter substrate-binding protein [Bordetella hinzii]QWF44473.1 siderophore ABC transporter substrate-binding protein [Bordetella hinzii
MPQYKGMRRWLAGAMLAMAPVLGQAAEVKHAQGSTQVPGQPAKTVVMDMAVLDTLHTLGVEMAGVPAAVKWPDHLAQYADKRYAKVGSMFEPDYEAIHRLAPQVIFVAGRSAPKYGELSRLAPTVDLTVDPKDLVGSVERNARLVADIYGRQAEAEAKIAALKTSIAALQARAGKAGTGLIILTTGGKMSAYGPGSRFGVIHDAFGLAPAARDLKVSNHGQAMSFELISQLDPDWLFVIDRDAAIGREGTSARQLLDNALMRQTKAWKSQHVVYLNAFNWYSLGAAGLTSLQQSVQEVDAALAK